MWIWSELAKNALFETYSLEHDNVHTALMCRLVGDHFQSETHRVCSAHANSHQRGLVGACTHQLSEGWAMHLRTLNDKRILACKVKEVGLLWTGAIENWVMTLKRFLHMLTFKHVIRAIVCSGAVCIPKFKNTHNLLQFWFFTIYGLKNILEKISIF